MDGGDQAGFGVVGGHVGDVLDVWPNEKKEEGLLAAEDWKQKGIYCRTKKKNTTTIPAVVNKKVLLSSSLQMLTEFAGVTYIGLRRRSDEG